MIFAEDLCRTDIFSHLNQKAAVTDESMQWVIDFGRIQLLGMHIFLAQRRKPKIYKTVPEAGAAETAVQRGNFSGTGSVYPTLFSR